MQTAIAIDSLCKSYAGRGEGAALRDVSLTLRTGEFLTVVGSSGSGKSTLLKVLAGIEQPTSGTAKIISQETQPRIGFVFQANTVFPWRTAEDNLTYALELQGMKKAERRGVARKLCQMVGLEPDVVLRKYPRQLSGGQVRRIAFGMALAHDPHVLLCDEPTSQLDHWTKLHMQQMVEALWLDRSFTAIYVTHDIDESIFLGDRVLVLDHGRMAGLFEINLPRPRTETIIGSEQFAQYREAILNRVNEGASVVPVCA